jgi:hypothetical protein
LGIAATTPAPVEDRAAEEHLLIRGILAILGLVALPKMTEFS